MPTSSKRREMARRNPAPMSPAPLRNDNHQVSGARPRQNFSANNPNPRSSQDARSALPPSLNQASSHRGAFANPQTSRWATPTTINPRGQAATRGGPGHEPPRGLREPAPHVGRPGAVDHTEGLKDKIAKLNAPVESAFFGPPKLSVPEKAAPVKDATKVVTRKVAKGAAVRLLPAESERVADKATTPLTSHQATPALGVSTPPVAGEQKVLKLRKPYGADAKDGTPAPIKQTPPAATAPVADITRKFSGLTLKEQMEEGQQVGKLQKADSHENAANTKSEGQEVSKAPTVTGATGVASGSEIDFQQEYCRLVGSLEEKPRRAESESSMTTAQSSNAEAKYDEVVARYHGELNALEDELEGIGGVSLPADHAIEDSKSDVEMPDEGPLVPRPPHQSEYGQTTEARDEELATAEAIKARSSPVQARSHEQRGAIIRGAQSKHHSGPLRHDDGFPFHPDWAEEVRAEPSQFEDFSSFNRRGRGGIRGRGRGAPQGIRRGGLRELNVENFPVHPDWKEGASQVSRGSSEAKIGPHHYAFVDPPTSDEMSS